MSLRSWLLRKVGPDSLAAHAKEKGNKLLPAKCDECGKQMLWFDLGVTWPIPLSAVREKPPMKVMDVTGFCPRCKRMLCADHADWVPLPFRNEDWWVPACRDCQNPLVGEKFKRERIDKA